MVNASTPAGYVESPPSNMDIQTRDVVVETGNVFSSRLFLTLSASDGVCFAADGGSSDLFFIWYW